MLFPVLVTFVTLVTLVTIRGKVEVMHTWRKGSWKSMIMSFMDSESLDKIMNEADDFIFVSEYNHPFNCKSLIFSYRGQGLRLYLTQVIS